jgi:Ran GTPase-activating protein (RanGAP) involved in mRNA processing and transport
MSNPLFVQVLAATTRESREQMLSLATARQIYSKNIHKTLINKQDNRLRLKAKPPDGHADGSVVDALRSLVHRGWVLEALDLSDVCMSTDELRELLPVLMQCHSMTGLNMAGNARGRLRVTALDAPLRTKLCRTLRSLDLSGNALDAASAPVLARGLERCSALTSLNLTNNELHTEGARIVLGALHRGPASVLQDLNLSDNQMTAETAPELVRVLEQCSSLTSLCLDENPLGSDAACDIIKALERGPALVLQQLHLMYVSLAADGAVDLARAMTAWPALKTLNIAANDIYDEAAIEIAAALPQCPSLVNLDLRSTCIDDDGAKKLAEAMLLCTKLEELDLAGNFVKDEGFYLLLDRAGSCESLQSLSLDNNYISNEAIESARWPGNVEVGVQDQLQVLGDLSEDGDEDA